METVIIYPKNKEQLAALKAFAKALKIDFEIGESHNGPRGQENIKPRKSAAMKAAKNIKPGIL